MIKRLLIFLFVFLFFAQAQAQFDTIFAKTNIRNCADSLCHGFKTKNWELFTRYNHPALIGSLGGTKEFMNYMAMMFASIPDSAWKLYEPGKILQVIKTEGDLQTVIELKSVLNWEGRRITSITHLIGQSWDGGLFWTFFDSEGDRAAALVIKPDLSDKLIIPPKKEITESVAAPAKSKQNQ